MSVTVAKALTAFPAVAALLLTADMSPEHELLLFKWAMYGGVAGGYVSAVGEFYNLMVKSHANWIKELGLALLRLSIGIPFGVAFALWMASSGDIHHWKVAFLAFIGALVGIVVKPVIEKMSKKTVENWFPKAPGDEK